MITLPVDTQNIEVIRNVFSKLEVPKPVAFITTISTEGITHGAMFNYFHVTNSFPPICIFSISNQDKECVKSTLSNLMLRKECVINLFDAEMYESVLKWTQSGMCDQNQITHYFELEKSQSVQASRLLKSPIQIECSVNHVIPFGKGDSNTNLVLTEAKLLHVKKCVYEGLSNPNTTEIPLKWVDGENLLKLM